MNLRNARAIDQHAKVDRPESPQGKLLLETARAAWAENQWWTHQLKLGNLRWTGEPDHQREAGTQTPEEDCVLIQPADFKPASRKWVEEMD